MWRSVLGVWGNVLGCGWKCRKVLGEVWESALGCGGKKKFWGKCGKVCCGVGKVRGKCGEKCRGCGEVCWGCGGRCRKVSGEVWGVWESVLGRSVGGVGKCVGGSVVWGVGGGVEKVRGRCEEKCKRCGEVWGEV